MKHIVLLTILFALVHSEEQEDKYDQRTNKDVVNLTSSNMKKYLETNERVLVKFFTMACGHCIAMETQYIELAKRIKRAGKKVKIAEVDCSIQKEIVKKYKIDKFPTILLFINNEPIIYNGDREENDMYNWLDKKEKPFSLEIDNKEDLEKYRIMDLSVLFVYPEEDKKSLREYQRFARDYDLLAFAHINKKLLKELDVLDFDNEYGFIIFRNFDEGNVMLNNNKKSFSKKEMKEFFELNRYPNVGFFDQDMAEEIFGDQIPTMFCFTNDETLEKFKLFEKFAAMNKGKVKFVHAPLIAGIGKRLAQFFGIDLKIDIDFRIIGYKNTKVEVFDVESESSDTLQKSLDMFLNGGLTPMKTEEL